MQRLNRIPQNIVSMLSDYQGRQGTTYWAQTRAGSRVRVWVADANTPESSSYFCHGHALGTFREFGYTVYSGPDLQVVLRDEYRLVGSLHNGQPGDIVVWHHTYRPHGSGHQPTARPVAMPTSANVNFADHSAILVRVAPGRDGTADLGGTIVNSKNGVNAVPGQYSIKFLTTIYGSRFAVFRRA